MRCIEHNFDFVRRIKINGQRLLNKQCLSCGEHDAHAYKISDVEDFQSLPFFSQEKKDYFYEQKRIENVSRQIFDKQKWLDEVHSKYLKTDRWKSKRLKVLERDNGICQACLINVAKEVHHISYKNHGDEPLFDLISVCVPCHNKIHKDQ